MRYITNFLSFFLSIFYQFSQKNVDFCVDAWYTEIVLRRGKRSSHRRDGRSRGQRNGGKNTASFGHQSYTIGPKTVYLKWIKTNHRDIRIVRPGAGQNVYSYCNSLPANAKLYGVNGTFYFTQTPSLPGYSTNDIHKISMYNSNPGVANAQSVRPVGTTNQDNAGLMFCQNQTSSAIPNYVYSDIYEGTLANYRYQGQHSLDMTNIRWAVGGFGLYLDSTFADAQAYHSRISADGAPYLLGLAPRTAIFYIGRSYIGENTVLFTVFNDAKLYDGSSSSLSRRTIEGGDAYDGVTPYELRSIIKDVFPTATTHGIILDGGGSTGIAYKNASGGIYAQMVDNGGSPRIANTMIVTPM